MAIKKTTRQSDEADPAGWAMPRSRQWLLVCSLKKAWCAVTRLLSNPWVQKKDVGEYRQADLLKFDDVSLFTAMSSLYYNWSVRAESFESRNAPKLGPSVVNKLAAHNHGLVWLESSTLNLWYSKFALWARAANSSQLHLNGDYYVGQVANITVNFSRLAVEKKFWR